MSAATEAFAFDVGRLVADLRDDGLEAEWAEYVAHEYVEADGPLADEITGNALTGSTEMVLIDTMAAHDIGAEFAGLLIATLRGVLARRQDETDDQEDDA